MAEKGARNAYTYADAYFTFAFENCLGKADFLATL